VIPLDAELEGPGPRHSMHARLGCGICERVGMPIEARELTKTMRPKDRSCMPSNAAWVRIHRCTEMQLGSVENVLGLASEAGRQYHAGIVNEMIDLVVTANRLRNAPRLLDVGQIDLVGVQQIVGPARLFQSKAKSPLPFSTSFRASASPIPEFPPVIRVVRTNTHDCAPGLNAGT